MNNRRPADNRCGGQDDDGDSQSITECVFSYQLDALCTLLAVAWCDSDRLWRRYETPDHFELTCNLHAAARLAHRLYAAWESERAS
jgi:hypothetical protein